ncbi:MAG: hypothetical protein KKB20_07440 [Proteobacteria bacterium]|nr:hypothetical protein [Pseudomonadota bacterium]
MRGQNILRIIALIGLCALVYYFSFDNGRRAMEPRVREIEAGLLAKDRIMESMALEVRRLKEQLANCPGGAESAPAREDAEAAPRVRVQLDASRLIFDNRLLVTCLGIDREKKQARILLNLIDEDTRKAETLELGHGLNFSLAGQNFTMLLEQIQTSSVSLQFVKR